ncbi:MAG: hypothetical protein AAF790_14785, partial [Planctomycetota bacterium]
MRRLLQRESHADTSYDRPTLPWVCGLADQGAPCELGPTPRGRCPLHEACHPARSLRKRRGRVAVALAVFTLGAVTMLLGTPWRRDVLAPGPLSQAHARLIAGAENRCTACHPGGVEAALVGTWLAGNGLAENVSADGAHATQSALCMECHRTQIDPEHALAAHGLPPGVLKGAAGGRGESNGGGAAPASLTHAGWGAASLAGPGPVHAGDEVACAVCHQEHHGALHNLSAITDARCQACHQERYDRFATDHPGFGNWPYRRRTRINFDHNSHAGKHYAARGEEFRCATCHTDGPGGEVKLLTGYEASCAKCHDESIASSTASGVAVLSLPMLDREAVALGGVDLGPWPDAATGDYDGDLPAIAKLLLAADPTAAAVMNRRGFDFSFFDLDPDSPADARDARTLAEALRQLLDGLSRRGHGEVLSRAATLTGGPQDGEQAGHAAAASGLAAGLPSELVDALNFSWFGGRPA